MEGMTFLMVFFIGKLGFSHRNGLPRVVAILDNNRGQVDRSPHSFFASTVHCHE